MSLLDSVKNKAASLTLRAFLNQHVSRYAEVGDVTVNMAGHHLSAFLTPKGGSVTLFEVHWVVTPSKKVRLAKVWTDCQWIHLVLQDHLVGKEFDIPPAVAKFL